MMDLLILLTRSCTRSYLWLLALIVGGIVAGFRFCGWAYILDALLLYAPFMSPMCLLLSIIKL